MAALLLISGLLSSCKKGSVADVTSATDAVTVNMHMNIAIDEAANVVSRSNLSGLPPTTDTVQGGTLDTSQISSGIITVTYDGSTVAAGKYVRTGSMTISLENYPAQHWKDSGAVIDVVMNNLKFVDAGSNLQFTYSGPHQVRNLTGGLAYQMLAGTQTGLVLIQYRHTSSAASITFDSDTVRTWSFNRLRNFTDNGGVPYISLTSDHTEGGYTNVEAWGINRHGTQFYDAIASHVDFNNIYCSLNFRDPVTGLSKNYIPGFEIDVLYGIASDGSISSTCPYGFRTSYTNSKNDVISNNFAYWQ